MTSTIPALARLTKVPLREVWNHEAYSFTQWLALPENLDQLGEEIEIELSEPQTEVAAGPFRVDILAHDSEDNLVIIENQLEASNHDHLGKIITYAAVHKAQTIVWIVANVREEHEQAINWLNDHTDEEVNIFLIQIGAVRIGNSTPAPVFDVIVRPNSFVKKERSHAGVSNEVAAYRNSMREFFAVFAEHLSESKTNSITGFTKALPQNWLDIRLGSSRAHIAATIVQNPEKFVGIELYIPNDSEFYDELFVRHDELNKLLGCEPEWQELPGKKASRIRIRKSADFVKSLEKGEENYLDETVTWMCQTANMFADVFGPLV